jgi:hypothetical protein
LKKLSLAHYGHMLECSAKYVKTDPEQKWKLQKKIGGRKIKKKLAKSM